MAITIDVTVHCDDCGGWLLVGTSDPEKARDELRDKGWECSEDLDLCPSCDAERDPEFQDTFTFTDLRERNPKLIEASSRHTISIVDADTGEKRMTMGSLSPLEDPWHHPRKHS